MCQAYESEQEFRSYERCLEAAYKAAEEYDDIIYVLDKQSNVVKAVITINEE